jgi:methyltransferase (TIGR00027 family)
MGLSPVGLTSVWTAAARALESEHPQRLFFDPYAAELAGPDGFSLLKKMHHDNPHLQENAPDPYLSIRTRYFDDSILRAIHQLSIRQVVMLAAGMDTRAFRLQWPRDLRLFEIDRKEVFDHKEPILDRLNAKASCSRRIVVADLTEDWVSAVIRSGLTTAKPTAFLMEGLLTYLDSTFVGTLFQKLRHLASAGSWLGVDLVGVEFLSSRYTRSFLEKLEELGCPWRFGVTNPEGMLASFGWDAKVVLPGDPEANYGRWPYPVAPRTTPGVLRSYLVTARRMIVKEAF